MVVKDMDGVAGSIVSVFKSSLYHGAGGNGLYTVCWTEFVISDTLEENDAASYIVAISNGRKCSV